MVFLHLGADVVVPTKDVIAIFDIDSTGESDITQEFLKVVEEEGFVRDISEGEAKSLIVTTRNVYFSPISSATLGKRAVAVYGQPDEAVSSQGG